MIISPSDTHLHSLGGVDEEVGSRAIRSEAPNLTCVSDIPSVLVSEDTGTKLEVVAGSDLAIFNGLGNFLIDGLSLDVETVVLVLGLGQGSHRGLSLDSLPVSDDGVGDLERDTGVVLNEILQANLEMELSGTGNNVLSSLGDPGLNARVRLGETLETLDELRKIVGVLDLDGNLHDRRYTIRAQNGMSKIFSFVPTWCALTRIS